MVQTPLRVLIVDSDRTARERVRQALQQGGWRSYLFHEAESALQGIEIYQSAPPDVLLLAGNLPKMEIQQMVSVAAAWPPVPVVFLTDQPTDEIEARISAGAVQETIAKTQITPDSLTRVVRYAIECFQLHQQLQDREERCRLVSELGSDYAFATRVLPTGELFHEWVTAAFEQTTGYKPEELQTSDERRRVVHPEDQALHAHHTAQLMAGQPAVAEFRIFTKSGELRWLRVHAQPVTDQSGHVVRLYGAVHNITERKRAEQNRHFLSTLDVQIRALTDPTEICETALSALGRHLQVARCLLNEVDPDTLQVTIHCPWHTPDVLPLSGQHQLTDLITPASLQELQTGHTVVIHDTATDPHSADRYTTGYARLQIGALVTVPCLTEGWWVALLSVHSVAPRCWSAEEVALIEAVAAHTWPAMVKAQAEQAVRVRERQLRLLTDSIPGLVAYIDADTRFRFANATYEQWFGKTRTEIEGHTVREIVGEAIYQDRQPYLAAAAAGQQVNFESTSLYPDGVVRTVQGTYAPQVESNGQVTGFYALVTDITERKRAEARLATEHAITQILAKAHPLEEALPTLLRTICTHLPADVAVLWLPDNQVKASTVTLRCVDIVSLVSSAAIDRFITESRRRTFAPGEGLPGRVWARQAPIWIEELQVDPNFPRARFAADAGLESGVGFPILSREECSGVIELFTCQPLVEDQPLLQMMTAIGSEVGQFLQRKQIEAATTRLAAQIQQERERLASLIAHVPGIVWEAWGQPDDQAQRINFVSNYVETLLGYSVEEWLATSNFWLSIVHPEDKEQAARTAAEQFRSGKGGTNQFRWLTKDGQVLHCEAVASVILDEVGQPVGMRGITFDRTERKQAEEHLRTIYELSETVNRADSLEQVYAVALAALVRVLHVDRASILLFDEAGIMRFKAWHGLSTSYRQQAEGHSPWAVDEQNPVPVLIPDVERVDLGALQAVIWDEGIRALAFIPLVEQGQLLGKFMLYYNQPHAFSKAEVQLAQTIARHVAHALQRKQAEEMLHRLNEELEQRVHLRTLELEWSNHELDQFAYVASHDLKTPLRGITHLAQWISEDAEAVLPPASQTHLAKLRGRIQRMEKLLDDLLAYSRAGRYTYDAETVETSVLVQGIVEMLAPAPGFAVTTGVSMPTLVTPRVPLEMVLRNLISNAMKHHDRPDGHVHVEAKSHDGYIEFIVIDDGPGIDPQFHERIFGMFQTLKPRDQVEGSGMGLAIAKKIVEHRGGVITVRSTPGQGATFHFTWPTESFA